MLASRILTIAAISLALAGAPAHGFAQSQAEKTGSGGVAAGQELGGMPITVIAIVGLAAIAAGVAIASAASDHHNNTGVATVTSTTTR